MYFMKSVNKLDTTTTPYQLVPWYFVNLAKNGYISSPQNFIVGSGKYHTLYKETCKIWILDVSFWIIVPWSLKTVEIVTDWKQYKQYTHIIFLSTPSKQLLENIAWNRENCQNLAKIPKMWTVSTRVLHEKQNCKNGTTTVLCSPPGYWYVFWNVCCMWTTSLSYLLENG